MSSHRFFAWRLTQSPMSINLATQTEDSCPEIGNSHHNTEDWPYQNTKTKKEEDESYWRDVHFRSMSPPEQNAYIWHKKKEEDNALTPEEFHAQQREIEKKKCLESLHKGRKLKKHEKRVWREMHRRGEVGDLNVIFEKPPKYEPKK